ncbi:hypothetical protein DAPPUDRAFT_247084 [Daphnia pulex]|uniref:Uncharacterized protein n=1 Tax=Daphnia pulex TaxID=6669 RepID=E9GRQ6_DAPPU|nr:hypothetical protein DAPPUDRAFT_247084 [Daphnia pulex]|eukprot:EFX77812.1 hypothetical protein DAPPUDRAFT_247084 [Daphnia pulex]
MTDAFVLSTLLQIFNVFQMAITVDEKRAAQAVTGFTPEERRIQNILNALPQGIATVNVFQMTIIVDHMRAAQALTGLTTKEW